MQLDLLTIGEIIPDVARDLHVGGTGVGILVAAFALIFAAFQLPAGLLFSRGHQKVALAIAAAVVAAGNLLFAVADSFWVAVLGRFLSGAAGAFFFLGFTSLMAKLFAPLEFGRVLGANQMIKLSVATCMLLVLPGFLGTVGWRGYLWGLVVLFLFLALAVLKWVPSLGAGDEEPAAPIGQQVRSVLSEPNVRWSALAAGLGNGCMTAFLGAWLEPFLLAAGFSSSHASWLGATAVVGLGVGIFSFGWISDLARRRKLPLVLSGFLGALAFTVVLLRPELPAPILGAALFLAAALGSAPMVLPYTLAKESVPLPVSSVSISVTNLLTYLFMAGFQAAPGFWLGSDLGEVSLGLYQAAMSMVPLSLLLMGFVALLLRETAGRQP